MATQQLDVLSWGEEGARVLDELAARSARRQPPASPLYAFAVERILEAVRTRNTKENAHV